MARPVSTSERVWRWCRRNPAIAVLSTVVVVLLFVTTIASMFLAISERNSRLDSQANSKRESLLIGELSDALTRGTRERANLLTNNGLWHAGNHNVGEAMLWFSEAAQHLSDSTELNRSLVRIQSWLQNHPMPVGAVMLREDFVSENRENEMTFQPDGTSVMYRSGSNVFVWNHLSGQKWTVNETFKNLRIAAWSRDGHSLFLGLDDGRLLEADVRTRRTSPICKFDEPVKDLGLVSQGDKLAVAVGNQVFLVDPQDGKTLQPFLNLQLPVLKLIANPEGQYLAVVDQNHDGAVYRIDPLEIEERFRFHCRVQQMCDLQRFVWPVFAFKNQALVVRTGEYDTQIFRLTDGKRMGTVSLAAPTFSMSVAADGMTLVTGSANLAQHYRLRQLRKGDPGLAAEPLQCQYDIQLAHDDSVLATAMGRNGLIATGGANSEVRLWRMVAPSLVQQKFDIPEKTVPVAVMPHQSRVFNVAFSDEARYLATLQSDGLMRIWKIPSAQSNGFDLPVEAGGSLVKLAGNGRLLVSGNSRWNGHMSNASVYDFSNGRLLGGNQGNVLYKVGHLLDSELSPDATQLATVHAGQMRSGLTLDKPNGMGGWLRIWNYDTGELLNDPIAMPSEPRWVAYHPSGKSLAVCTALMQIVMVDAGSGEIQKTWNAFPETRRFTRQAIFPDNPINEQIEFSPDGNYLGVRSSRKPGLAVWDYPPNQRPRIWIANQKRPVADMAFSPCGRHLAVAGGKNPVAQIYDLETGEQSCPEMVHASKVNSVRFNSDGKRVVTSCQDGHARLIDWASGEILLNELIHRGEVVDAAFMPDNAYVITLGADSQLRIWNSSDGQLAIRPLVVPAGSIKITVSPDSRRVAISGGQVRVIDMGELRAEPRVTLNQARRISEILSSKSILAGSVSTLSTQQWLTRWREMEFEDAPNGESSAAFPIQTREHP